MKFLKIVVVDPVENLTYYMDDNLKSNLDAIVIPSLKKSTN